MRDDGERLALPRLVRQADEIFVARRMVAEAQDRRFREGPLEVRLPDRGAGGARTLSRRFLGACDQAAGGHNILDPREAGDIMHRIQQHQTQNRADAGDGWPPVKGVGIVLLRRLDDRQCNIAEQPIVVVNQGEVDLDTLLDCGIKAPLSHAVPIALVGQLLPHLGQVVLAVRLLDVGKEFGALTRQRQATSEEVPGRPHLRWINLGLRAHAPTEQHGAFLGVDRVVFGLAPMERFHRQGVAQDKRQPFLCTQVGEPVPRQETCDGADHMVPRGRDGLEQGVGTGWYIPVQYNLAILTQATDVHGAGMQVDATVKWMLVGGASPEVSSLCE
jgi:hypothetical protein